MPGEDRQRRLPTPIDCISDIQDDCCDIDDDIRWLLALLSYTGMRLGEAVGMLVEDIHLDDETPHINLTPHPWRRLKTRGSGKCVPLAGKALWVAPGAIEGLLEAVFYFQDIIAVHPAMSTLRQQR